MVKEQLTLTPKTRTTYGKPQYTCVKGGRQRIELHRGCPWQHEYCYEPRINEDFPIPPLTKNYVEILDMNLLARENVLSIIQQLGSIKVDGKVVRYEAVCGFDFRFLTQEIADALWSSRFVNVRLAWDGPISDQMRIKDALGYLLDAGYRAKDIMLFMLVNWKVPKVECERKLDIMKVWNVQVCDCCFDGGYRHATPLYWKGSELEEFRRKCRKHNQLVNFGIDPEVRVEGEAKW